MYGSLHILFYAFAGYKSICMSTPMVRLTRYWSSDLQTRGILRVGNKTYKTLELPWRGNRRRISCIPPRPGYAATYTLSHREAHESRSFKYPHFILDRVPHRSHILIHRGNLYSDTLGCILVGRQFTDINADGYPDVTDSKRTLRALRHLISDGTPMQIRWATTEESVDHIDDVMALEEPDLDLDALIENISLA